LRDERKSYRSGWLFRKHATFPQRGKVSSVSGLALLSFGRGTLPAQPSNGFLNTHPDLFYLTDLEMLPYHIPLIKKLGAVEEKKCCEAFHKAVLNEFYRVIFRKKFCREVEELQKDLDEWMDTYNNKRTHQGERCHGRTAMETFIAGLELVKQKNLDNKFDEVSNSCQL